MYKLSSFAALVTATLISIAAESVWSHEASPDGTAAPGWYPPPPNMGRWPASSQSYGQLPPTYPAVPVNEVNPLSAELKYTQGLLAAKSVELGRVDAMLEQLRIILQHRLLEDITLNEKLVDITNDQQSLQLRVTELTTELNTTNANNQAQTQVLTIERDRLHDDLASRDELLSTLRTELQTATQALQQAQSETSISSQQLSDTRAQVETFRNELTELEAQLETRSATLLETAQTLGDVIAERDGLLTDLAARSKELTQAQAALTSTQSEAEALRQEDTAASVVVMAPETREVLDVGAVEIAALQTTDLDTDKDGIPDSNDLCSETQKGITVESTGCAAGVAINLEGVNFLYDSHELTDEAQRILNRVADILSQQPDLRLEVAGHTDAQGDPAYNQWLSLKRAEAVRDYMVSQGMNPGHIGAGGYGGQRPIADNTTREGLRMNRRVELRRLH